MAVHRKFCVWGLLLDEKSKSPLFRRGGEQSNLSTHCLLQMLQNSRADAASNK